MYRQTKIKKIKRNIKMRKKLTKDDTIQAIINGKICKAKSKYYNSDCTICYFKINYMSEKYFNCYLVRYYMMSKKHNNEDERFEMFVNHYKIRKLKRILQ
jgi:hypothetical protein